MSFHRGLSDSANGVFDSSHGSRHESAAARDQDRSRHECTPALERSGCGDKDLTLTDDRLPMSGDKRRAVNDGESQGHSRRRMVVDFPPSPPRTSLSTSSGSKILSTFREHIMPLLPVPPQAEGSASLSLLVTDLLKVSSRSLFLFHFYDCFLCLCFLHYSFIFRSLQDSCTPLRTH